MSKGLAQWLHECQIRVDSRLCPKNDTATFNSFVPRRREWQDVAGPQLSRKFVIRCRKVVQQVIAMPVIIGGVSVHFRMEIDLDN